MTVVSVVVGAVTHDGVTVVAHVDSSADVRVAVDADPGMTSPTWHGPVTPSAEGIARVVLDGLAPETRYYVAVEHDGVLDTQFPGTFRTLPVPGSAASFTFAAAGDAGLSPATPGVGDVLAPDRLSNHAIFATLADRAVTENWVLFAHLGDLHYYDLGSDEHGITGGATLDNYRRAYSDVLAQPNQHLLYRSTSWLYVWDDHDFGPDDSDGTHPGKGNAAQAYRERVPHYPLADTGGIWQAVQIGRVLVVASDTRYYRSPNTDLDDGTKTMLGEAQIAWLRDLLMSTSARALVWLMPSQWLRSTGSDTWAAFATERAALVDMLTDLGWHNRMVMVSADRHAARIHPPGHPYGGWPVMQAAPLDAAGGSPISDYPDGLPDDPGPSHSQYGTVAVDDAGHEIRITLTTWRGASTVLHSLTHTISTPSPATPATTGLIERAIAGPHRMVVEARAVAPGQTGPDPDGVELEVISGDVRLDGTADVYGTLELETTARWWPRRATDPLAPYGQEVYVRRGIDLGGGGTLWVPLGYYRVDRVDQDDATGGVIRVGASDRMAAVIDARFVSPRQILAGTLVGAAVRDLVGEAYPGAVVAFDDESEFAALSRSIVVEESRYDALREIVTALGKVMHFDGEGRLVIRSTPSPTGPPRWSVRAGQGGVLVNAARSLSREGVYNGVIVRGEGGDTTAPVLAVVVDGDPRSPTRWGGPFGNVPRFWSSPLITDAEAAEKAATTMLTRYLGLPYAVDYSQVPNPALRPWDTVRVVYDDGTRESHVVESVTIPLAEDVAQTATTREQTLALPRRIA